MDSESGKARAELDRSRSQMREVYNEIATHFSKTRAYPWPEVETFLDESTVDSPESVGLDIGCGNGRHTALLADVVDRVVGLDVSRDLLFEASAKMAEDRWEAGLVQGDAASLPLETDSVDLAVYVATLHHLPDRETRVESLAEVGRVLTGSGRALVSAWSTEHDRFDGGPGETAGFDTSIDWTLPGGETVPRFYHIYAPAEFEEDLRAGGLTVEDVFVSSGNCYAEIRE